MTAAAGAGEPWDRGAKRRAGALAVLAGGAGLFLAALDFSINVSLPTIRDSLGATLVSVQWIIIIYHASRSGLALGAGGVADRFGLKRLFLLGILAYTVGVALISVQSLLGAVVLLRVVQGIGAGALFIIGPALVARAFGPERRGAALGVTLAAVGAGQVCGTLGGGWLAQNVGWEAIFWARVPIGAAVLLLAFLAVAGDRPEPAHERARRFDWTGAALLFAALFVLVLALSYARLDGWTSTLPLALGGAATAGFLVFLGWERRVTAPVFPPGLLRLAAFRAGAASNLLITIASFVMWFLFPFYMADVLGRGAAALGSMLATMAAAAFGGSAAGGWLADRLGSRRVTFGGAVVTAAALAWVGALGSDAALPSVALRVAVLGAGFGIHQAAVYTLTLGATPRASAGAGSSALAVTQTIGTVASIAVMTSLLAWRQEAHLTGGVHETLAFLSAYRETFMVAAVVAVGAGLAILRPWSSGRRA